MSIESVMPSNHHILCCPLLLPPSIFPSISVFSNESVLCIRWPKDWSFSFSISPTSEYSGLISFRIDRLDRLAVQGILKSLLQHHSSKASILHTHTHIHEEITKREMECMNRIKNEFPNTSRNTNTDRPPLNNDIKSIVPPGNMEQDQSRIGK